MSQKHRVGPRRCIELPQSEHYVLHNAHSPACCIGDAKQGSHETDIDSLVNVVRALITSKDEHWVSHKHLHAFLQHIA